MMAMMRMLLGSVLLLAIFNFGPAMASTPPVTIQAQEPTQTENDEHQTPLMLAIRDTDLKVFKSLLDHEDVNARDEEGQTPFPLNSPRPRYTEQARHNKVQGAVLARVLVGADGSVKQVRITKGLPDGLTNQAILAAYNLRFKPAMKDGKPVAFWQAIYIEFKLR